MKFALLLRRSVASLGVAIVVLLAMSPASRALPGDPVLPPLRAQRAQFFREHPIEWARFVSKLPRRPGGVAPVATPGTLPPFGGTWQTVNPAPTDGLFNPLLLTDGTVMVAIASTPEWYKLTPDINGSYVNGTWTQLASLPVIGGVQYAPQYFSSAVLPDGRVLIMGGEYNNNNLDDVNLGAIYDPLADAWTPVSAPAFSGWAMIGDAESVVLADGTFMLAACCAQPDVDALFDAATLSWTSTGAPSAGEAYQDEQGYNLLPNGNVLTIDIWTNSPNGNATNAEQYVPSSGTWISAGNTPVSLADPYQCGNWEIGPAALRPDGTVVAFGGNTGCSQLTSLLGASAAADPTAIYDTSNGTWTAGPSVPEVCVADAAAGFPTRYCTLADAPAAVMPNGNILFAASTGYGEVVTHFFEFTSATSASPNAIDQVADPVDYANVSSAYYYNFLVLPNGQILSTDFSSIPEVYVPTGSANGAWAPTISTAPSLVNTGGTYSISGLQFNGLSQGAYYGDDVQGSTNYPIVRITNNSTGHVFYARSFGHGTMSIEPGAAGSTNFTVPGNAEMGASSLVVIANGIPSAPAAVAVNSIVTVLPATLPFGNEAIDIASTPLAITVTNNGSVPVRITDITLSGQNPHAFSQTSNCGPPIAAAGRCTISVVFNPSSAGPKSATLSVNAGNGAGTLTVALKGTGVVAPYMVSPTSVGFGAEATKVASASTSITVKNASGSALPITSIALSGQSPAMFSQTNTCQNPIAVAGTCTIRVVFTPTSIGAQSATLSVTAGNGAGTQTVDLTGTGIVASYTALPASLPFGSEALGVASGPMVVTVTNGSAAALPITSITLSGQDPHMFSETNTCGAILAAGASCTISVVFDPATAGAKTATLSISARDGAESQSIALSGAGA